MQGMLGQKGSARSLMQSLKGSLAPCCTALGLDWLPSACVQMGVRDGPSDPLPMECTEPSVSVIFQAERTQG